MTLLTIITDAARELALTQPNTVASSTDVGVQQLHAFADALGQELITNYNHDWQELTKEATITTVASQSAYDLPSDYSHQLARTHWDETNKWRLQGPISPQGWQWLQSSSLASTGPRYRFRVQDNKINIHPTPGGVLTFKYQYSSNAWITDPDDATVKSSFTKDGDTPIFRHRLMVAGVKLKYYEQKGFDTTIFARDFLNNLESAIAQDEGAPTLNLSGGQPNGVLLDYWNIPDGGFG